MPRASIIIPVFNAGAYIRETIQSILDQSFTDFELIFVDDGSTDDTAAIIQSHSDNRIRYFYQPNSGKPASPRNKAIKQSVGDVIFIFDSDDIMLPGKLATTMECLDQAPGAGLAFTGFGCIDEFGEIINPDFLATYQTLHSLAKTRVGSKARLIDSKVALRGLAYSNFLGTSGVAVRREVFRQVGYFDEEVRNSDDYLMWQAIASQYDFLYIPEVLHHYRNRSGNISSRAIEERAPGLIACTEKMKHYHRQDPEALRQLDSRIRRLHFEAGYSCFSQYKLGDARRAFIRTLSKGVDKRTLFYLALSLLPARVIAQLKQFKQPSST